MTPPRALTVVGTQLRSKPLVDPSSFPNPTPTPPAHVDHAGYPVIAWSRRSRPAERSKVLAAIFATRNRRSVIGTYSIKRDGDSTLRRYGAFQVVAGRLHLLQSITG